MPTKLQVLTQKRNFAKMRLRGTIVHLKKLSLSLETTGNEKIEFVKAIKILNNIDKNWDASWEFLKAMFKSKG